MHTTNIFFLHLITIFLAYNKFGISTIIDMLHSRINGIVLLVLVAPLALGRRQRAALPADELPEILPGGLHARCTEREAPPPSDRAGPLLRAAPPANHHRGLVLRVRQHGQLPQVPQQHKALQEQQQQQDEPD